MTTLAISCGDPAGVGYEVVAKSFSRHAPAGCRLVFFGVLSPFESLADHFGWARSFLRRLDAGDFEFCVVADETDYPTGVVDERCGEVAYRSILGAAELARQGKADAIVTAPISKEALKLAGHNYPGHTELLAELFDVEVTMMLFARGLRVALATTHIPLREVHKNISAQKLLGHIRRIDDGLRRWFGKSEPVISVLALNPHAGEGGTIGDEETQIAQAVELARKLGIKACGPLVPDVAFLPSRRRKTDAYLAMYHDQGLIPLKMVGFAWGVNITLGLPVPRTSPDHGTAFDIAGLGRANPISFINAVRTAAKIAKSTGGRRT